MMVGLPQLQVTARKLPRTGSRIRLEADGKVLDALSQALPVAEVLSFDAKLLCKPWRSGMHVSGIVSAEVAQECIASLEIMENRLEAQISRHFLPADDSRFPAQNIQDGELVLDPEGDDPPDLIEGDSVDLWAVMVEELDLQIDPFPRKAGICIYDGAHPQEEQSGDRRRPFAGLQNLLDEKNPQNE